MRFSLENKIRRKLSNEGNIWPWLIEYAADTFNRFKVGDDGATPFKRFKGRGSNQRMAAFAEKSMFHVPKQIAKKRDKAVSRWEGGILLGFHARSNEYLIGTHKDTI